jgi:SAM-dependent methyltransferase
MMSVFDQIQSNKMVCPQTGQSLCINPQNSLLVTQDGTKSYPLWSGKVPILLADPNWAKQYAVASERMTHEYTPQVLHTKSSWIHRIKAKMVQDYRTRNSRQCFQRIFNQATDQSLCLSIGGGPNRTHPALVNLNIGPFPNVDVVADAHQLPYADNSVDALYGEAVLEHLHNPVRAVKEMCRVLKKGGEVFSVIPFLQAYHGYPFHYQNYTLTGHQQLFETNGFEIEEAGTCVGPMYTLVSLTSTFIHEYLPCGKVVACVWGLVGAGLRPLDQWINLKKNSFILASTTYLAARKK